MKVKTEIGFYKIILSEPNIPETYTIEPDYETNKFFVASENGYDTRDFLLFDDIEKAIKHTKAVMKDYFSARGMDNPKGF